MMEEQFRAWLAGDAAVAALVPASCINWGTHPQGAGYPGIVLNVIDGSEGVMAQGTDGLFTGRVQVDCYATTYSDALALARVIDWRLSCARPGNFQGIFPISRRDHHETGAADRPFRVSLDFQVSWSRT